MPQAKSIRVRGAKQHNLKGVDVEIPRDQMTVCCGMSGSGKSSLAMDTIYAEGQRRYVESLSSYARQFVGQMQKPALDHIDGLSPAIAIEQKHMGHTPRSTVGTVTEIYDYLRILMARLGTPHCPACDIPIGTQTSDEIVDKILSEPAETKLYLMAPLAVEVGEKYENLWAEIRALGYIRVRIDGQTHSIDQPPQIDRRRKHLVEVVIDRVIVRPDARSRIADTVETALSLGKGVMHVAYPADDVPEARWRTEIHSQHFACDRCGRSFERLTPHSFSFNSSLGWCPACEGLGTQTGANPAALLRDPKLTLRQGAVGLWPATPAGVFASMLEALSAQANVPLDVPFEQLSAKQRRVIFHGTGEEWIDVYAEGKRRKDQRPLFRFQFKGLYPALEEAARLSPALRAKWEHLVGEVECSTCGGSRLRDDASAVRLHERTVDELCRLPLGELLAQFNGWTLDARERKIAGELVREVRNRLQFLVDVGLEYLTLGRGRADALGRRSTAHSPGQSGRQRLVRRAVRARRADDRAAPARQSPAVGRLEKLRDLGNTLLVVEHDREVVLAADELLDFGPAAGDGGGQIVARGTPAKVAKQAGSVTGPYLSGKKAISVPSNRRMPSKIEWAAKTSDSAPPAQTKKTAKATRVPASRASATNGTAELPPAPGGWLEIVGARHNNLRNVDVRIPLGALTVDHRRQRQRQKLAGRGRAVQLPGTHAAPGQHHSRPARRHSRRRAGQQGDSRRSATARADAHFESGHVHRRVRIDPPLYSQLPEAQAARLHRPPVQLQRAGRRCEKPAKATARSASRCTFCPMSGSSATRAAASATIPRRWP